METSTCFRSEFRAGLRAVRARIVGLTKVHCDVEGGLEVDNESFPPYHAA